MSDLPLREYTSHASLTSIKHIIYGGALLRSTVIETKYSFHHSAGEYPSAQTSCSYVWLLEHAGGNG